MALLLLAPAAARAQLPSACAGSTTAEARICLTARLAAADDTLGIYLRAAEQVARPRARLDSTQTAWRRYRDVTCRAAAGQYEGGSLAPVVALQCRLELTRERTRTVWRTYLIDDGELPEPQPSQGGT